MQSYPHGTTALVPDVVTDAHQDARNAFRYAKAGWLAQYPPTTRADYLRQLELLEAWCERFGTHPFALGRAELQMYAATFEERGLAPSTQSHYIIILRSFYRYATDEEIILRNPTAKLRMPQWDDADVHRPVLSRAQAEKFLAAAERMPDEFRLRDHALASVLLLNGLRVSSALSINVETLDVRRGHYVANVRSKGGKYATMPLAPITHHAVAAYVGERTSGPLFLGAGGQRMRAEIARRRIHAIGVAAGLGHVTPHSLRRTFVTEALNAGWPIRDVQLAAQHASMDTTALYDRRRNTLERNPTYLLGSWLAAS